MSHDNNVNIQPAKANVLLINHHSFKHLETDIHDIKDAFQSIINKKNETDS